MRTRGRVSARLRIAVVLIAAIWAIGFQVLKHPAAAQTQQGVDTALVVSVDVSGSVDEHRYRLQMEGIASALVDPDVLRALLNGPNGGILFTMVTWADRPQVAVPWRRISSLAEAEAAAEAVRRVPRHSGEFTCVARMMRFVADKIVPQVPLPALRVVVDVSGDGSDNCNPEHPIASIRDELVAGNVTVNGLPILEGREAATLESWYQSNVVGGPGAFVLPADGYGDFGRAIKQKFVVEISDLPLRTRKQFKRQRPAIASVTASETTPAAARDPSGRKLQ